MWTKKMKKKNDFFRFFPGNAHFFTLKNRLKMGITGRKVLSLKNIHFELSDAVSHTCVWFLDRFVQYLKVWRFWAIFTSKLMFSYLKILCKSNQKSWTCLRHGIKILKYHTWQGGKFGYHWGTTSTQKSSLSRGGY